MRIFILTLALAGLLSACTTIDASMFEADYGSGHFGGGVTADRLQR